MCMVEGIEAMLFRAGIYGLTGSFKQCLPYGRMAKGIKAKGFTRLERRPIYTRLVGSAHALSAQSLIRVGLFVTLQTVATRLLCPLDSPGKNTGVGCRGWEIWDQIKDKIRCSTSL